LFGILEGDGGEGSGKGKKKQLKGFRERGTLWSLFFFIKQNPPNSGKFKNCIGGRLFKVWINYPNSIYVERLSFVPFPFFPSSYTTPPPLQTRKQSLKIQTRNVHLQPTKVPIRYLWPI
jgi:hypothetical protein